MGLVCFYNERVDLTVDGVSPPAPNPVQLTSGFAGGGVTLLLMLLV